MLGYIGAIIIIAGFLTSIGTLCIGLTTLYFKERNEEL